MHVSNRGNTGDGRAAALAAGEAASAARGVQHPLRVDRQAVRLQRPPPFPPAPPPAIYTYAPPVDEHRTLTPTRHWLHACPYTYLASRMGLMSNLSIRPALWMT